MSNDYLLTGGFGRTVGRGGVGRSGLRAGGFGRFVLIGFGVLTRFGFLRL